MSRFFLWIAAALLLPAMISTAVADSRSFELTSTALSPIVSAELGDGGMAFQIEIPDAIIGKRLDAVLLELRPETSVDLGAISSNIPVVVAPCVATAVGTDVFSEGAVTRIVAAGTDKRVVLDITAMVKEWIAAGTMSHQVAIGPMVGSDATLSLHAIAPDNVVAKVTFLYQHRFGQRAPRN